MDESEWDVIILGAGPAGAVAALTLARAGCQTLLLDRRPFPRDKCCGDALSPLSRNLLIELRLWDALNPLAESTEKARLYLPDSLPLQLIYPFNFLRREVFDARLATAAVESGAVFRLGKGDKVTERSELVEVELADSSILRAKYLVLATGVENRLAVSAGLFPSEPPNGFGLRRYYHLTEENKKALIPTVLLFPHSNGFGWIWPVGDDLVNVGLGFTAANVKNYKIGLDQFRSMINEDKRMKAVLGDAEPVGPIAGGWMRMGFQLKGAAARGRVFTVGDAASLACKVDGGGIFAAMWSGRTAGEMIARTLKSEITRPDKAYCRALSRKFGREYALLNRVAALHQARWLREALIRAELRLGALNLFQPRR